MSRRSSGRFTAIAAAVATATLAAGAYAGQIFSFENGVYDAVTNPTGEVDETYIPPNGEPNAYVWGDSFNAHRVFHNWSTVGSTDGDHSIRLYDPAAAFSQGTQVIFNDPTGSTIDPRRNELVTGTKMLMDISMAPSPAAYSTLRVDLQWNGGGAAGHYISNEDQTYGGNGYKAVANPNLIPAGGLTTTTFTWDYETEGYYFTGDPARWPGLPPPPPPGNPNGDPYPYMIMHICTNGEPGQPIEFFVDNVRIVNENTLTHPVWKGGNADWTAASTWTSYHFPLAPPDAGSLPHDVAAPNGIGAEAIFYGLPLGQTGAGSISNAVTVSSGVTVGSIVFDSQITSYDNIGAGIGTASLPPIVNYTLSGSGSLTMDVASGNSEIYVIAGNHNINVPVTVNDNLRIDTSSGFGGDSGAAGGPRVSVVPVTSLSFGTFTTLSPGVTLSTAGAGTVTFKALRGSGGLSVRGGTAVISADGGNNGTSKLTSLAISANARLDVNDNDLVIGSATPKATIENYVRNARNNGAWNMPGLTSTAARTNAAGNTNLGVLSGAEYNAFGNGNGTFSGQAYTATDTLVKYTWNGDTNFSGVVNFDDYVRVDVGFNTGLTGWGNGDFNYSGGVNFDDYVLIDVAFNTQNGTLGRAVDYLSGDDRSSSGAEAAGVRLVIEHFERFGLPYASAFLAAVPEPTTLGAAGAVALATMLRRGHSRSRRERLV
jgi:hypothetical protein